MINAISRMIKDAGQTAYASGRARALMGKLKKIPRETVSSFEQGVEDELIRFEDKLLSFTPDSIKEDLTLFLKGKREVDELKRKFMRFNSEKRRAEGIKLLKLSKYGQLIKGGMSNKMIEVSLDRAWFAMMRKTGLRQVMLRIEEEYDKWLEHRAKGREYPFKPEQVIREFADKNPIGIGVLLKCYYEKIDQINKRRHMLWEGYSA